MQTTTQDKALFEQQGFSFEHPGFWAKDVGGKTITVADGVSMNGYQFEVQIMEDGCCIAATEGFDTAQDAIDMALREVADVG